MIWRVIEIGRIGPLLPPDPATVSQVPSIDEMKCPVNRCCAAMLQTARDRAMNHAPEDAETKGPDPPPEYHPMASRRCAAYAPSSVRGCPASRSEAVQTVGNRR